MGQFFLCFLGVRKGTKIVRGTKLYQSCCLYTLRVFSLLMDLKMKLMPRAMNKTAKMKAMIGKTMDLFPSSSLNGLTMKKTPAAAAATPTKAQTMPLINE